MDKILQLSNMYLTSEQYYLLLKNLFIELGNKISVSFLNFFNSICQTLFFDQHLMIWGNT